MLIVFIIGAYLLGAISSAIIVCKLFHLPDPRATGSHNPGATNVLRIGGKSMAALVLVFDVFKGLLPVLLAKHIPSMSGWMIWIGLAAVVGHMFPVFYHWKGGKGVATALGVYFGFSGLLGLYCLLSWLVVFKLCRYSSLASLITVCLAPLYLAYMFSGYLLPMLILAILIVIKHRQNIVRLFKGTESKMNLS